MVTTSHTLSPGKVHWQRCTARSCVASVIRGASGALATAFTPMSVTSVLAIGIGMLVRTSAHRIIMLMRRSVNASHVTTNAVDARDLQLVTASSVVTSRSSPMECPARTRPTSIAPLIVQQTTLTRDTNGVRIVPSTSNMPRRLVGLTSHGS